MTYFTPFLRFFASMKATRAMTLGLLLVSAVTASACGEDEPHLYFPMDPTVAVDAEGYLVVDGGVWSVIPWPAGNEFCIRAEWEGDKPNAGPALIDEECSTVRVPEDEATGEEYMFQLRSAESIPAADRDKPWSVRITIDSHLHGKPAAYDYIATVQ